MNTGWHFLSCALLLSSVGCQPARDTTAALSMSAADDGKRDARGLHNVFRLSPALYTGSSPEGDEGFESLRAMGIQTVISVDGARPDVDRAHRFGLRYVHLPFGYDGIPEAVAAELVAAVRELPGPVYLHCHHGKHRGPAAAAFIHRCTDDNCTVEHALAEMTRAGTDPHYVGLFESVKKLNRPGPEGAKSHTFPEIAPVPALTEAMIAIDDRWDRLKAAERAGWKPSQEHPDIDLAHEALQLRESYREAARLPQVAKRSDDFRRRLSAAEMAMVELETALRATDTAAAAKVFRTSAGACSGCHSKYRDRQSDE